MFYVVYFEGKEVAFGCHVNLLNAHRVSEGKLIQIYAWFPALAKFGGVDVTEDGEMELPDIIQRFGPIVPLTGAEAEAVRRQEAEWDENYISTSTKHVPETVQRVRQMDANEIGIQMASSPKRSSAWAPTT